MVTIAASEGVPGENRRRQLKKAVVSSIESLGFSVTNLEYDIYKMMEYTKPDASLSGLVQAVRSLREPLPVCPSA